MRPTTRRLLLAGPLPPPVGGIATWTEEVANSDLARSAPFEVFDTAPRDRGAVDVRSRFRPVRALHGLGLLVRFAVRLAASRPDLVHICSSYHWATPRDALFVWLARASGARVCLHLHGGDFPVFAERLPSAAYRLLLATLRRCSRVIVITRQTEAWLSERIGADRVRYLPNFVPELAAAVSADVGGRVAGTPGSLRVVFAGLLTAAKGVRELVLAAAALPCVELTLAGPAEPVFLGALADALRRLGDRVHVLGEQPRDAVACLLRDTDVFALPSHREGFPVSLLEAMAAGAAIVATPVGAVPDLVRDGQDALLVPPGDVNALVRALAMLARDPALRHALGEHARARALTEFGREAILAQLAALHAEVIAERSRD